MSSRILEQDLITKNAMKLFKVWYKQAEKSCPDSYMYFCLSTVDHNQKPSSRYVCLTGFDEKCFRFSTNDNSPKMEDIRRNAYVSMNFFWASMQKSIRINGLVTRYSNGDADYTMCPGFQNQITLAAVEYQSRPIKNVGTLDEMREKVLKSNAYKKCPDFWITQLKHQTAQMVPKIVNVKESQAEEMLWEDFLSEVVEAIQTVCDNDPIVESQFIRPHNFDEMLRSEALALLFLNKAWIVSQSVLPVMSIAYFEEFRPLSLPEEVMALCALRIIVR
uniref:pyridoxal 5'-phosphate synthase n=1 Tax=Romanomermis culicivorax TaxID=13658 RepID=A0A915HLJ6_ROMCU